MRAFRAGLDYWRGLRVIRRYEATRRALLPGERVAESLRVGKWL